jgi:hypothetical protein
MEPEDSIAPKHVDNTFMYLKATSAKAPSGDAILRECLDLAQLLIEKNRKYGNSALEPVRVFSKADAAEQIKVRIDDKLSRLRSAQADEDEDVIQDLLGYLILLRIASKRETNND